MGDRNNIPSSAKCVFKGETYEVWQWEQEMFDGSLKTFESLKRLGDVNVIALVGDQIIVQEQSQPHRGHFLSIPGGRCELNEDYLDTARRELIEETGYDSNDINLWKVIGSPYSTILRNSYYYIARNCFKKGDMNLDSGEKIKNKLVSYEEFHDFIFDDLFRDKLLALEIMKIESNEVKLLDFKELLFR